MCLSRFGSSRKAGDLNYRYIPAQLVFWSGANNGGDAFTVLNFKSGLAFSLSRCNLLVKIFEKILLGRCQVPVNNNFKFREFILVSQDMNNVIFTWKRDF